MSWLYSIIFASLLISSGGNLPEINNYNYSNFSSKNVFKFDETERFEQSYPLNANGTVSVSNVNGSITVGTWDRNEVKFEYVKTADTKEGLSEIEVKIDARPDVFSVETNYGDWRRKNSGERRNYGKLQIEYRLVVPRNAVLDDIETVNGSVSITNAGNSTKASAVNGEVRATNLGGAANLSTVNGTVVADFDRLEAKSKISLNTVNGTVELIIPSDANATVKADTVNGNISNDFGLPVRKGEYVGRDMYGKIGSGDVQIRLNSVNGALSVRRKNDGKNLNPATNLLKSKNQNDWNDGDFENNSGIRPPKSPKPPKTPKSPKSPTINIDIDNDEINKAIKEGVEEGLKEAQKELRKIKPELEKIHLEGLKQAELKINSEQMKAQIKQAQEKYREAFARMSNANWTFGSPSIEEKSESFVVKGTPKVTIEAGNFTVFVRGWDKPEVQYAVTRISKVQNGQMPLDLNATQAGSDVNIKVSNSTDAANKDFLYEMNRARIEVFVPRKSNLKIVTSGEIRLEGVSGEIDLQGADETVDVRDAGGKISVGTVDGRIRLIGFRGVFDGKTNHGMMNLEGDFQNLAAQTVDGTIILTLPENPNVTIESNRKNIQTDGVTLNYIGDGKSTSTLKFGNGGGIHKLYTTADGKVIVRSATEMKIN
ncbi:MAG: DUF4097 family beta strand repeat-containing protein [Acidobacteriota bacterium]|nr:DUF4097 family beta strand repeat-containing protein [Acidobacteriota bacterium]